LRDGAPSQPVRKRQPPPIPRESAGVLFIVTDRPEVEWKLVGLAEMEPEPQVET
jgi:hypothetical protein